MTYNPNTYGWYQCDEENYDSGTPPEEQMATEPVWVDEEESAAKQVRKAALLTEYSANLDRASEQWSVYLQTGSDQAFSNYLGVNRSLSAIYTELVRDHGMTLESVRKACAIRRRAGGRRA